MTEEEKKVPEESGNSTSRGKETAQGSQWHCILNFKFDERGCLVAPLDELELRFAGALSEFIEDYPQNYAYIVHDKDTKEDGTLKTPHIHLVLWGAKKRIVKRKLIRELAYYIGLPENLISVSLTHSVEGRIRYLLHMDNPDKCQDYQTEDIHTNNPSYCEAALSYEGGQMSGKDLYELMKRMDFDEKKVAIYIGPRLYSRFYRFINLWCYKK